MLFDESIWTKYLSSVHFKDVTPMSLTTHRLLILFNHVQHFYILTHKFTFIYVIYLLLHKQSWLFIKHIPDTLHLKKNEHLVYFMYMSTWIIYFTYTSFYQCRTGPSVCWPAYIRGYFLQTHKVWLNWSIIGIRRPVPTQPAWGGIDVM